MEFAFLYSSKQFLLLTLTFFYVSGLLGGARSVKRVTTQGPGGGKQTLAVEAGGSEGAESAGETGTGGCHPGITGTAVSRLYFCDLTCCYHRCHTAL